MIPFSFLTPAQREQVAHIFYDDLFGTDPAHFEYLVKDGQACNRYRAAEYSDVINVHIRKPRNVAMSMMVRDVEGGDTYDVIKSIARSVVEHMAIQQDA